MRKGKRDQYGRRLAAILLGPCIAWPAHRLIAFRLGTPPLHVIVVDILLFGVLFGAASITFERSMAVRAALAFAAAAAGALAPDLDPPLLLVVSLSGILCALAK